MGFEKGAINAARRAERALAELKRAGLMVVWHADSGNLYAIHIDRYSNLSSEETSDTDKYLPCGSISDGGDW